jgi:hypothetical protein
MVIKKEYHSYQQHTKFYPIFFLKVNSIRNIQLLGNTNVDFDVTDELLIRYFASDNGENWEYNGTVHQLCIDFKKAYESVRREVFYNILINLVHQLNIVQYSH